jgi:hypothetical protein
MIRALAIIMLTASSAWAYDDPAVAVCQFSRFHGHDLTSLGYTRTTAEISLETVILTFEKSVLNTKPKPERTECQFAFRDGKFHIVNLWQLKADACNALERRATLDEQGLIGDRDAWEKASGDCLQLYDKPPITAEGWEEEVVRPLTEMGIYPIDPKDTEMKP